MIRAGVVSLAGHAAGERRCHPDRSPVQWAHRYRGHWRNPRRATADSRSLEATAQLGRVDCLLGSGGAQRQPRQPASSNRRSGTPLPPLDRVAEAYCGGVMVDATPRGDRSGSQSKKEARELANAKVERDWNNFSYLSGKRLSMREPGRGNRWGWELVGSDGTVHVTVTRPLFGTSPLYRTNDGTYEWRRVGKARSAQKRVEELVDIATNVPILRKSGRHYREQAGANVVLADQSRISFPVRESVVYMTPYAYRHSLMSAVDRSENTLIEYRSGQSKRVATEIIIRPGALAIPYIEVIAAISSPWFRSFFQYGAG
jgi:hypothetical protein